MKIINTIIINDNDIEYILLNIRGVIIFHKYFML